LQASSVGLARTIYIYIYGAYTFFWQGIHQLYGHIRCVYTVLANPNCLRFVGHGKKNMAYKTQNTDSSEVCRELKEERGVQDMKRRNET
jgi:hypothetical protein